MTWLEIIESSAIGGGGLAVGVIAYLKSKDKNKKEVKSMISLMPTKS